MIQQLLCGVSAAAITARGGSAAYAGAEIAVANLYSILRADFALVSKASLYSITKLSGREVSKASLYVILKDTTP